MPVRNARSAGKSAGKKKAAGKPEKAAPKLRVPVTHRPADMTDHEWQTALRKQIAEQETFVVRNTGDQPVYSDYEVYSPKSGNTYKVALRSLDNSRNFCSCPDFKTNLLGTCKHIEAVRLRLSKKRGSRRLMADVPELSYTSMYVSYADDRKVKVRIGTDRVAAFRKWKSRFFDSGDALLPAAVFDMERLLREARAIDDSFRCYPDAVERIIELREQHRREALVTRQGRALLEGLVKATLFPYQQEGVLFALKAGRCILADDMGLGKTLQAIAWAMLMRREFGAARAYIVCPTSLKYQWKTEIEKFTGTTAVVVEGLVTVRQALYETDDSYFRIVSYHVAGNDWQYINQSQSDIVILDEAQRIKNWRTRISQNIKRLRAPYTMVLTGTPLENNIEELYSLVQFVNPYLLGSLHHFLTAHQVTDGETGKVTGYRGLNEIGARLSGTLLRRTKKEVLSQLPERMDKHLFVPMTEQQAAIHEELADHVARLVNKWKRMGFLPEADRQRLLNSLNMMRMVCNSTYILDQQTNYQTKIDELFNILDELFGMDGEKVVVFSQWERMTRLIATRLEQREICFANLHGGIPSKSRADLFTRFREDPECRVFLSTDAGGVGLNLQSAAYLINMDIPWNPAVLEQRIARIHRMGQRKNVSVINLVAQDTIEHRMLSVLKFKTSVAEGILDNGADSIFLGEDRFRQFMNTVEELSAEPAGAGGTFDAEEVEEIAAAAVAGSSHGQQEVFVMEAAGAPEEPVSAEEPAVAATAPVLPDTAGLLRNGMSFLSQLTQTLSSPAGIKSLADSITSTDEQTGQAYLKIPLEHAGMVENALSLIAGLLKGVGK